MQLLSAVEVHAGLSFNIQEFCEFCHQTPASPDKLLLSGLSLEQDTCIIKKITNKRDFLKSLYFYGTVLLDLKKNCDVCRHQTSLMRTWSWNTSEFSLRSDRFSRLSPENWRTGRRSLVWIDATKVCRTSKSEAKRNEWRRTICDWDVLQIQKDMSSVSRGPAAEDDLEERVVATVCESLCASCWINLTEWVCWVKRWRNDPPCSAFRAFICLSHRKVAD